MIYLICPMCEMVDNVVHKTSPLPLRSREPSQAVVGDAGQNFPHIGQIDQIDHDLRDPDPKFSVWRCCARASLHC